MEDKNIAMAVSIARAVREEGGRTYYVGGYVRDQLLGRENKDIDIEVHGISVPCLEGILDTLGERLAMGASFGIMSLRHYDLDIAMPRAAAAAAHGHTDFASFVDPFIGEEKAALRRDFTVNALMQDVLTGEVLDFFGGREDLARKRIRCVSDQTFADDPLRVFRAAQFAARFGFSVDGETCALAALADVSALPAERIMKELEKALLKAEKPSVFFRELREMKQLSVWYPEVQALIGVLQREKFHPEGDVWNHTLQVLDAAAGFLKDASEPLRFMLSALCHDFGKAVATENGGELRSIGHDTAGLPIVQRFLDRITNEVRLKEYVLNMTRMHMEPNQNVRNGAQVKAYMKMFDRSVCPKDLLLLAKADSLGRLGDGGDPAVLAESYRPAQEHLEKMLEIYEERMRRPHLMGKDLIEAGMKSGPMISEALAYAHKLRLAGLPKDEQLRHTLGVMRKRMKEVEQHD